MIIIRHIRFKNSSFNFFPLEYSVVSDTMLFCRSLMLPYLAGRERGNWKRHWRSTWFANHKKSEYYMQNTVLRSNDYDLVPSFFVVVRYFADPHKSWKSGKIFILLIYFSFWYAWFWLISTQFEMICFKEKAIWRNSSAK